MPEPILDPQASRVVGELPRRVARVTHALLARANDSDGVPVTAMEVCEYDSPVDAPTVAHTRRALRSRPACWLVAMDPSQSRL